MYYKHTSNSGSNILLALVKFAQEGILQVKLSCTEELQTFKRPASTHKGSPVRAENLGRGYHDDYDPRPKKFRNLDAASKAYFINNATTNFCSQSGLDITWRYTYEKANLGVAELDHDYLAVPLVEC